MPVPYDTERVSLHRDEVRPRVHDSGGSLTQQASEATRRSKELIEKGEELVEMGRELASLELAPHEPPPCEPDMSSSTFSSGRLELPFEQSGTADTSQALGPDAQEASGHLSGATGRHTMAVSAPMVAHSDAVDATQPYTPPTQGPARALTLPHGGPSHSLYGLKTNLPFGASTIPRQHETDNYQQLRRDHKRRLKHRVCDAEEEPGDQRAEEDPGYQIAED
ncbi:uncharacterized protein N0V89_012105 [Didymosphaeria variabile]|uniref:Uncharacterized protein n=1 Tax=Didymosphaeria variabile TaxID=1932322 RepID=A0A9W8X9Y9_9PLEO|nr:uncharacterized protein N0V89_012105 [Didymosphaeria variabile]KAJ4344365.1 hypothetical protein N0V89_012105 [Didymosphaeria variabile]